MGVVSYERSPLLLLRVGDSTTEEILSFLTAHSDDGYRLDESRSRGGVVYLKSALDGSTVVGLLPSTVLLYDPDDGSGVRFLQHGAGLERFGVVSESFEALSLSSTPASRVGDAPTAAVSSVSTPLLSEAV